ncbi:PREDICTED: uncharacterized protein LOC108371933 [Rhagoletis zephyria]|uniref:uncharacterized protein LOC108371933 n=1 Tax=Rhagoletis zephyria TaxID=28612 RepID=UPI0008114837|nr:PREDICTED: uncharacterized protein LOC108371933 [Rhagoletis zephyria]
MSYTDEQLSKMSDSEDEDDKLSLQALKEISIVTENAECSELNIQDEVKQSLSDIDCEEQECDDPLHDKEENLLVPLFQGEYNEFEFINEHEEEQSNPMPIPSRSKRAKTFVEFQAPNGIVWSTNKTLYKQFIPTDSVVLQQPPTGKGPATKIKNALEAWYLLLDERILAIILAHTNEKIRSLKGKSSFEKCTDIVELRAWLGLNYLCGIFRNTSQPGPLNELWTWELGNSIFRATMTWKRFEFLAKYISFGSPSSKRGSVRNLLPITDVWERFLANCRSYYSPSGNCFVNDSIVDMKDGQENSHLTILCDAKSLYICNALISNQMVSKKTIERTVLHLVTDIKGSNRNIILPDLFTSSEIALKLEERQLSLVGALSDESEEVPKDLIIDETKQKLYSEIGCLTRRSGGAAAFLLSNGLPNKVAIEHLFTLSTKSSDRFGKVIETFNTNYGAPENNTNYTLTFFYRILNFAALNAWILMQLSAPGSKSPPTQREFQRDLGLYLTQMQLKRQLHERNKLTLPQKLQVCEVLGESTEKLLVKACEAAKKDSAKGFVPSEKLNMPEGLVLMSKTLERRQRCAICSKYRTRMRCQQCLRALCYRHLITRCNDCMGVTELPDS